MARDFFGADWIPWAVWGTPEGWTRRSRFFVPGEIRLALLYLLQNQPRHGYELMKELELRSGGAYKPSAGTIYPTLQQLEDEGLLLSEQKDGKRIYKITDAGLQELAREAAHVQNLWQRANREDHRSWPDWDAMSIVGSVSQIMKTAMQLARTHGNEPGHMDKIRQVLERCRVELEAIGSEWQGSIPKTGQ